MSTIKDYVTQIERFQKIIDNSEKNHIDIPERNVVEVPENDYYDMLTATDAVIKMLYHTKVDAYESVLFKEE